jgi:hypothetical protein
MHSCRNTRNSPESTGTWVQKKRNYVPFFAGTSRKSRTDREGMLKNMSLFCRNLFLLAKCLFTHGLVNLSFQVSGCDFRLIGHLLCCRRCRLLYCCCRAPPPHHQHQRHRHHHEAHPWHVVLVAIINALSSALALVFLLLLSPLPFLLLLLFPLPLPLPPPLFFPGPFRLIVVCAPPIAAAAMLRYEKLWYLFDRYLRVSPGTTGKCMLHNSVGYRNTHSRDPITLLSIDIVFETFLEIGVSDLLVWTQRLQDPLYMEV